MPSPSDCPRPGLYKLLLTERIQSLLAETPGTHDRQPLGKSEAARTLARHLADFLTRALDTVPDDDRPAAQVAIANALIDQLATPLAKVRHDPRRPHPPRGPPLHRTARRIETPDRPDLRSPNRPST
jgi:hypothetical protein